MLLLLLTGSVMAFSPEWVTPSTLRAQLAQPAVSRYQLTVDAIPTLGAFPEQLNSLKTDPLVPEPAREWLLHQAAVAWRNQPRNPQAEKWLESLRDYPSHAQLAEDVEGRLRSLPLAPVATAVRATLIWWQQQTRAEQIRQFLSTDTVMAIAARWAAESDDERAAWLRAVQAPTDDWLARLAGLDREKLAQHAPPLAASLALQLADEELAAAVLRSDNSEAASALLGRVPERFPNTQFALYQVALTNPLLRSQSWFQLATLDQVAAQDQLRNGAIAGDRSAIAAWLQQQGDRALPELQRWLQSKTTAQQLNAVYALRLLATPAAHQQLTKAKNDPQLSARVRQELRP